MIKKIEFVHPDGLQDFICLGRLQFLYKTQNNTWEVFQVGNIITSQVNKVVFENLTAETNFSMNNQCPIANIFLFNGRTTESSGGSQPVGSKITITFTEPVSAIKGFYYFGLSLGTQLNVYDEYDNLLCKEAISPIDHPIRSELVNPTVILNSDYFYETPFLRTVKIYKENVIGTIETTDISHVSKAYSVDKMTPVQTEPGDTTIRYLLSFDGRITYKAYNHANAEWIIVDKADVLTKGMTNTDLEGITSNEYSLVLTDDKTIDVFVGMITKNSKVSPSISRIIVDYLEIV